MSRIHRRNSFGGNDSMGSVVLSKDLERKITNGLLEMKDLSPKEAEKINETLELLMNSTNAVELPKSGITVRGRHNNHVISSRSSYTIQNLSKRRYERKLEGMMIANSVQYIPLEVGHLERLPDDLKESILSTFTSLVLDHIVKANHEDESELIKWGSGFLRRLGKILMLKDVVLDGSIKPVEQYADLKKLEAFMEDMESERAVNLTKIKQSLEEMQSGLNDLFRETFESIHSSMNPGGQTSDPCPTQDQGQEHAEDFEGDKSLEGDASKKNKSFPRMLVDTFSKRINQVLTIVQDYSPLPSYRNAQYTADHHRIENELYVEDFNEEFGIDSPPTSAAVLVRDLITGHIMSGYNDSRVQLLFQEFSVCLGVSEYTVVALENHIAADFVNALQNNTAGDTTRKMTRSLKIAAVTVSGGALIALSAGMATPAVAAGVAMLGLGSGGIGAFLGTQEGAAFLVSLFGVGGGTGLSDWKGQRRAGSVRNFEFKMLHSEAPRSLAVAVCVSGFIQEGCNIDKLWEGAFPVPFCDLYTLKWETQLLKSLCQMIYKTLSQPFSEACSELWQKHISLDAPINGIKWPLGLVQYANSLDNTWLVCRQRACKAGALLATAISDKQAVGERPMTLVGYSMGARVILYALLKLYERKKCNCVKDVVLIGLPSCAGYSEWEKCRSVVAGRLINIYSIRDWILGFLYRYVEPSVTVAGLGPVDHPAIENWDVSQYIKFHNDYMEKLSDIFTLVHFDL